MINYASVHYQLTRGMRRQQAPEAILCKYVVFSVKCSMQVTGHQFGVCVQPFPLERTSPGTS